MIRSPRACLGVMAMTIAIAISGCSDQQNVMSLAATKPSVQLIRNELISRIPTALIDGVAEPHDSSIACASVDEDPEGRQRAWRAGEVVVFKPTVERDVHVSVDVLVASFTGNGWTTQPDSDPDFVQLTRGEPQTTVEIRSVTADIPNAIPAQISLMVTGPCVETAGADSDEVTKLESEE
jgi:hypothetical protein